MTETYTSDVHGITVSYPGGWTERPATEPWVTGELTLDAAFADSIVDVGDDPAITVTSQPLNDMTPTSWAAEFLATRPCGDTERYTIAGVDGVITECEDGHHAVVSVGQRAYVIWLYRIADLDYFKEILGSVELDPGAVNPLTETFTSALHGMSVDYPAGSVVAPGSGPWTTSLPGTEDVSSRDTIWINQDANVFIGLASQPLAGRSGDEWIAEIAADPEWGDTCDTADTQTVTVDGAPGVVALCPERDLNALVTDDERGYFIVYYGSDDRARFDEILATVQLDPGAVNPLTETFTSALHGMSVDYPAGSVVAPGSGPWTTSLPGTEDVSSRDTIWINQDANVFIGLASQPLAGRSGDEWIAEIAADPEWGDTCDTADTQTVTVDGAPGVVALCPERDLNALVTDDERGYFIVYYGSDDRARFDEILATVQLDPGRPSLRSRPQGHAPIGSARGADTRLWDALETDRQRGPFEPGRIARAVGRPFGQIGGRRSTRP